MTIKKEQIFLLCIGSSEHILIGGNIFIPNIPKLDWWLNCIKLINPMYNHTGINWYLIFQFKHVSFNDFVRSMVVVCLLIFWYWFHLSMKFDLFTNICKVINSFISFYWCTRNIKLMLYSLSGASTILFIFFFHIEFLCWHWNDITFHLKAPFKAIEVCNVALVRLLIFTWW